MSLPPMPGLRRCVNRRTRHCEERSLQPPRKRGDEAIQALVRCPGLLRFARNDYVEASVARDGEIVASREQVLERLSEVKAPDGRPLPASGVLSGSLYYHFPSKEDLLFTVHQESLTAMRREVEAAIGEVTEPWARLEEAIVAHCRILLGGSVTRAILTPPRYYNLQGVRKLVRQRDEYELIFARLIDELPLKPDCDRHAFRLSMLGAMNWTVFWFSAGGRLSGLCQAHRCARGHHFARARANWA